MQPYRKNGVVSLKHYSSSVLDLIKNNSNVIIYGAGLMGRALKKCLEESNLNCNVVSFMVGERGNNPYDIDGIPVLTIADSAQYKEHDIFIALHEKYINGAVRELRQNGFNNLIPITFDSDEWSVIRENWLINHTEVHHFYAPRLGLIPSVEVEKKKTCLVYVAKSIYDKECDSNELLEYEKYIQVGASLTDTRICEIIDCEGDNISHKNKRFCELTAMYWAWKNDVVSDYKGISHYRRRFVFNEDEYGKFNSNSIDFVVTVPVVNFDTVKVQFARDHSEQMWEITKEAICKIYPEYKDDFIAVENGYIYYGYNMFIAKKIAFDTYCEWLFPILFYCEEKIGPIDDAYQNRYAGFVAERLLTVFLRHNRGKYSIATARKHFFAKSEK